MTPARVAFLLPHFRAGGAERVVLNWIGALDRARFAPVLMLGRVEGQFLDLLPADVPVVAIGGRRALTRPWRIARALLSNRIEVAYSATSAMNLALLTAPTRVPRITSEHTPPAAFGAEAKWPLLRRVATALLRHRATAIAVPTQAIADEIASTRVHVIRNPVLANPPPPLAAFDPGRAHIVAAGRLVRAKGFDTLIDAAALLARTGRPFTLAIHGDGPERDRLARRIVEAGMTGRVRLAGHTADLAPVLAGAVLVVSSSRREGFGNVLVEAMVLGTPVLATRAGGPETFIEDMRNGFLVAPDNPAALAARMDALLRDPASRARVRAAARETAGHYTVTASTRDFTALLDTVLPRYAPT
ncbi:glycosyltransferase [uncultured Sphingomonas sp.]|uniref:glycosyltransferase n=1 Tax=uncultured Sphingomonas sp. TaxID=158754 RepID=UPI0025D62CD3|nr:glycosyltransferase [uncultured Sphingomonas sp.]